MGRAIAGGVGREAGWGGEGGESGCAWVVVEVEPAELLRRELNGERGKGGAGFGEGAGADEREGGEGLVEDVGEGDVDGIDFPFLSKLPRALQPFRVVGAVPAADQLLIALIFSGNVAAHEESAGLTRPGEQRRLSPREPGAALGVAGGDAPGPGGFDH